MAQATTAAVWVQWLQKSPAQAATTVTPGPGAKLATQQGSSPSVQSAFSQDRTPTGMPDKVRPVTHPPETQEGVYHGGRAVGAARPVSLSTLCLPPSPTQVALVTDPTREAACVGLDLS